MFAKAFGTTPVHELPQNTKKGSDNKGGSQADEASITVEPLDPSPVLEFLSHLGVSRHEVHSRVASALRSAIEDEIQRMPLPPSRSLEGMANNISAASTVSTSVGEAGHEALLNLLKSSWQFRDVPELRPILVCLLKRLGDHTPVQMLRRLGAKKVDSNELKNAELMSQLGISMRRLVWEADWDAKLELIAGGGEGNQLANEEDATLRGSTILADLIRPSVENYVTDATLLHAAELAFVRNLSDRRLVTKLRRTEPKKDSGDVLGGTGEIVGTRGTLASIGAAKISGLSASNPKSSGPGNTKEEKPTPSSAEAVATIKETIGSRPKLLGAVLDMLISEYATTGGGISRIRIPSNAQKKEEILKGDHAAVSFLGGATNLSCSLVSDILLTFGQLPRSYEVLGIMVRFSR